MGGLRHGGHHYLGSRQSHRDLRALATNPYVCMIQDMPTATAAAHVVSIMISGRPSVSLAWGAVGGGKGGSVKPGRVRALEAAARGVQRAGRR